MSDTDSDSDSMMRSMMGFSSFGTQRPASKKESEAPPSTGSNAAPVAKRAKTSITSTPTSAQTKQQSVISSSATINKTKTNPDINTFQTATATAASAPSAPGATTTNTTTFESTIPAPPRPGPGPELGIGHGYTSTQPLPPPLPLPRPSAFASASASNSNVTQDTTRTPNVVYAYTSPTNPLYNLTSSDLSSLRNGRRNAHGDTVFFKPGFIDEDPWKTLQNIGREELSTRNEG